MKHKKIITGVGFLLLGLSGINAQESPIATGGELIGSGGSISYSVGQVFYNVKNGSNGISLAEGVQQPFEISVVTEVKEVIGITLNVSAYPNPTTHYLIVKVADYVGDNLEYQLFDLSGKLIQSISAEGQETRINTQYLVPSVYLLKVLDNDTEIKIFKIIKN